MLGGSGYVDEAVFCLREFDGSLLLLLLGGEQELFL